MYIYPDNLKSKATLWLWTLRDLAIIGIGSLISVFALSQLGFFVPIVLTACIRIPFHPHGRHQHSGLSALCGALFYPPAAELLLGDDQDDSGAEVI